MSARLHRPARIGLLRNDALGDTLLCLPVATAARRLGRETEVELVCAPGLVDLMRAHPDLSEAVADPGGRAADLARVLRSRDYGALLVLRPTPRNALAALMAGIPLRAGTAWRFYGPLFNVRWWGHRKENLRHEVEYNLELLQALTGQEAGTPQLYLPPPPSDQGPARTLMEGEGIRLDQNLVALHPGSRGSAPAWPIEHFQRLAGLLRADGIQVAVTGVGAEHDLTARVAEVPGVVDLTGRTTLGQLAWVYKSCDTMISNSTGPLHLAAAVGTKVVGVYPAGRPFSPVRWGPWGPGHKAFQAPSEGCPRCERGDCTEHDAMARISPEAVQRVAHGIVEQSPHHSRFSASVSTRESR